MADVIDFGDEKRRRVAEAAASILGEAAPKVPRKRAPTSRAKLVAQPSITINAGNGDGNGIGNTIIKTERVTNKTIATPKPGDEHITEEQVRKLHDLKDEIIKLEKLGKRDPATAGRVWYSLNKAMGVGAMRMIPAGKFRAAEKHLQSWIGRLMDGKTVQKKAAGAVESRRISYIQTNMKKLDIEERVRDYMEKHFQVRSLKDLPDPSAMEKVYRYVASVKKELEKR